MLTTFILITSQIFMIQQSIMFTENRDMYRDALRLCFCIGVDFPLHIQISYGFNSVFHAFVVPAVGIEFHWLETVDKSKLCL